MKCPMLAKRRNISSNRQQVLVRDHKKPLYQRCGVGSFQNTRIDPDPSVALGQVGMQYAPFSTGCEITL